MEAQGALILAVYIRETIVMISLSAGLYWVTPVKKGACWSAGCNREGRLVAPLVGRCAVVSVRRRLENHDVHPHGE